MAATSEAQDSHRRERLGVDIAVVLYLSIRDPHGELYVAQLAIEEIVAPDAKVDEVGEKRAQRSQVPRLAAVFVGSDEGLEVLLGEVTGLDSADRSAEKAAVEFFVLLQGAPAPALAVAAHVQEVLDELSDGGEEALWHRGALGELQGIGLPGGPVHGGGFVLAIGGAKLAGFTRLVEGDGEVRRARGGARTRTGWAWVAKMAMALCRGRFAGVV